MAFTTCLRKLVLGPALCVAGVVAMHGVAGADEGTDPSEGPVQPAAARQSPAAVDHGPTATTARDSGQSEQGAGEGSTERQAAPEPVPDGQEGSAGGPPPPPTTSAASEVEAAQPGRSIVSPGPLTTVHTSPDLNCAVDHGADPSPEFFQGTACGTFLAVDGVLFGPADVPAAHSAEPRTAYTPVRQSPVTGGGSFADPYRLVTEVDVGGTGLSLVQVDSYVVGQESYRTDVTVVNAGPEPRPAHLYRAGDCFFEDDDEFVGDESGFGSADEVTGAVACVAGVEVDGSVVPGRWVVEWLPISPGSHLYEDFYDEVWERIGLQLPFPDLCAACDEFLDNAAGLSWAVTVPAGGSVTLSHLTTFSPEGFLPLTLDKTVDRPEVQRGSGATYRIVVENPNPLAVDLNSIVDVLPDGFVYVPGSTSGPTGADPTVVGRALTWVGPFEVPPFGALALEFSVTVLSEPGTYVSVPSADAGEFAVAPTGDLAPIDVVEVGGIVIVRDPGLAPLGRLVPGRVAGAGSAGEAGEVGEAGEAGERGAHGADRAGPAGDLPLTGLHLGGLLGLAGLLLVAGAALTGGARRG